MRLSKIERRRADQITDILNEQYAAIRRLQTVHGVPHHMPIQVTSLAGIDLQRLHTGGTDALGVVDGLLIPSITLSSSSLFSSFIVRVSSIVLPEPGLDTRLSARIP